ncbi:hypothetical protein GRX03_07470 [Halovenus sp. WSH3]|uniref:Uncharacterized protein n=1 Tax=Halovenus carboxidivorans TaxID=2692199 RepID=A0A6B0T8A5_9EURY|nr:helix-turn-helix domain-containing protein [Halovenus carboxidivorans]MXR51441.1 hypothetical protein [Halovenus carboxidivorans]
MAHSERSSGSEQRVDCQQSLVRAQLAVRPDPAAACAALDGGDEPDRITQSLTYDPDEQGGTGSANSERECHTLLEYEDRPQAYRTARVDGHCICPVFEEYDCLTEFTDVSDGAITVVVSVPSRETIRALVDALRDVGATVAVEWLVEDGHVGATTELDVSAITAKQQEALETALELGYYDSPRSADLSDCAEKLGISKSAVSQRLNAAETKLVRAFLGQSERT